MYRIFFGIPEIRDFYINLKTAVNKGNASKDEIRFYKKFIKTLRMLENNPRYKSLKSHEIRVLSYRYGMKVWQSYLENNTPSAGRIFWVYYPNKSITIIGISPHPDDNKHSYDSIVLSGIPNENEA